MKQQSLVILYCPKGVTPRLMYTLNTLFRQMSGVDYLLTGDIREFIDFEGVRLAYGKPPDDGIPWIPDAGLLFETGTFVPAPALEHKEDLPVIFATASGNALVPFDLFSACFWLLSRYEEYQTFTPDVHGRFPAPASWLHRHNLLHTPLVDLWLSYLTEKLRTLYPQFHTAPPSYRYLPTIDVDSAWAYRHKPFTLAAGGLLKAVMNLRFSEAVHRIAVLSRIRRDPFDTWHLIREIHRDGETPLFFFLVGKHGEYDKNLSVRNKAFRKLIRETNNQAGTGIHPSYHACDNETLLKQEIAHLAGIIGSPVIRSRQHFLRISFPDTYRILIHNGIREDYTLGFADQPGFRAGTCKPFMFFDLEKNEETLLQLFPLTVMDGTLRDYMQLSPDEASGIIRQLTGTVKQYGGVFVSLWHNETLGESGRWKGWRKVYIDMVNECNTNGIKKK